MRLEKGGRETSWESGHPLYATPNETEGVCRARPGGAGGGGGTSRDN